jgi:E3 ubiquitin-protein ligase makorin
LFWLSQDLISSLIVCWFYITYLSMQVCTFYQKGNCTYGSRCKYEHVKTSWVASGGAAGASSSSSPHQSVILSSVPASVGSSRDGKKEDRPLCSFDVAGDCPHGDKCSFVHGDLCPTCGKHSLHPFQADEREEHLKSCEKNQKFLVAVKRSEEIECSVCLDRVLSKPTAAERKFAVLPECNHPFCISCIRNWRNGSPASGMALRACPICRKTSHFVIPSLIWYSSKEEKQEIIDTYKARLR